jgi:hypothetical protein
MQKSRHVIGRNIHKVNCIGNSLGTVHGLVAEEDCSICPRSRLFGKLSPYQVVGHEDLYDFIRPSERLAIVARDIPPLAQKTSRFLL